MLRFLIFFTKLFFVLGIIGIIVVITMFYYFSRDLPDYSQLKEYYPPSLTRMYSADGKLIEEYAKERRIFIPISNIPKSIVHAFIAAEDKNFYQHLGIDIFGILRAALTNIYNVMHGRKMEGASTITQQVVKNFLLTSEQSFERKIKEAILSYRITQVFTKDQILELYFNQIYLGKRSYGVAMAALNYFNKSVEELDINESAVLASLPKAPEKLNPEKNYDRALERRNYVISRMYSEGYITEEEARETIKLPIILGKPDKVQRMNADYYAEKVRDEVIGMFGEEYFYTAGLTIITCVDSKLQKAAAEALRNGIRAFDMKKGYRGPITNIKIANWQEELKLVKIPSGMREYFLSVVLEIKDLTAKIGLINGETAQIRLQDMKWVRTNPKSIKEFLKIGDVIVTHKSNKQYLLCQIPLVNGGIMVIDHNNGRVLAGEGGYDFSVSKFDRTTQALRQPGSLSKPFVYLSALENGSKPNDIFDDAIVEVDLGPGLPIWRPKNYEAKFLGPITMRQGLEKSRNAITVRVGQLIGLNKVRETFKRFGINDNPPKVYSMVLGALETTLERMVTAYGALASGGRKISLDYIELIKDRKGNVIYKRDYSECKECQAFNLDEDQLSNIPPPILPSSQAEYVITDEASSYQVISMLRGSVLRGTSRRASHLKQIVAGKTGTTNDSKDAWYVGFTPKIVVGTYIGYDTPRELGKKETGATVALPIFVDFMTNGYAHVPSIDFKVPDSIKLIPIDYQTGIPSNSSDAILEAFKENNYEDPFSVFEKNPESDKTPKEVYDPFEKIPSLQDNNSPPPLGEIY